MVRSILITAPILSVAACFSFASGCSSSGGGTGVGSGVVGNDATGSSSGDASGSSGSSSGGDGPDLCTMPLTTVSSSMIPAYMPVMQMIGACAATDISAYITACDSMNATNATCGNWFNSAPAACANCLQGPVTGGDPGTPTGQGAIWLDAALQNIGANVPGCLDKEGMNPCATGYQNLVECIFSAGCAECMDQNSYDSCQTAVTAKGGACATYQTSAQSACSANAADGGLLANSGACSTDQQVLSVICGNGSGDGG